MHLESVVCKSVRLPQSNLPTIEPCGGPIRFWKPPALPSPQTKPAPAGSVDSARGHLASICGWFVVPLEQSVTLMSSKAMDMRQALPNFYCGRFCIALADFVPEDGRRTIFTRDTRAKRGIGKCPGVEFSGLAIRWRAGRLFGLPIANYFPQRKEVFVPSLHKSA